MFYKKGVDISSPKSMFNFINDHERYYTANPWNIVRSIANNVKVYNLKLSGDPFTALAFLQKDNYLVINDLIMEWQAAHKGYEVGFNGRSSGYLVLYNKGTCRSAIPEEFDGYRTYEDWKADLKDSGYTVNDFIYRLREFTKLVQDFDKLCDDLRDYVDGLSQMKFEVCAMKENIEEFNDKYYSDLEILDYCELSADENGKVDITEIAQMRSLHEALLRCLDAREQGYKLKETEAADGRIYIQYED